MRVIAGLRYFAYTGPVLLHSQSLMRLVGFNGREVKAGTCRRGVQDTDDDRDTARGPVCPEFIAGFMLRIAAGPLEKLFNGCIGLLAKNNFYPKKIEALLDASEIESTEQCRGRGMVIKEKPLNFADVGDALKKCWKQCSVS